MVSALYVVIGALLVMKFTLDVVRYRRFYRVAYGDGGYHDLKMAIRIHGNAIETIPLALFLLVMMEMNGADIWMVHLTGLLFLSAACCTPGDCAAAPWQAVNMACS